MTIMEPAAAANELSGEKIALRRLSTSDLASLTTNQRQEDWAHDFPQPGDIDAARVVPMDMEFPRYGAYLAVERATGQVVGTAGFQGPVMDGELEIGYGIVPSVRKRGYATECLGLLVRFATAEPDVEFLTAHTEEPNIASQNVLLNGGFMPVETDGPSLTFRHSLAAAPRYIGSRP
ncbi:GNAT family N-acetyltransferase [Arthrobacter roseus]|uniref:GNAT family N-acetyltransferase n=1 Tax=Arthrobacter roseus TaxID=136274 RepID=UPI001965D83F|nr:GNAT family N-acetyltransferase [Arthrobacter roseus]MBM7847422.1 RimJ/RimL family protein N-acetyltransferase [Arthrobacter roseus]